MALSAVLGAVAAMAGQAPPPHPAPHPQPDDAAPPAAAAPAAAAPGAATPDDDFIEFLGADDVGDADWWEFLKKSGQSRDPPRVPPQDAQQW
jgi:hypothetical protein